MTADLCTAISSALGGRNLVWFGTRGPDVLPLVVLENLVSCHTITGSVPIDGLSGLSLEEMTSRRVDLDRYDVDLDQSTALLDLRRSMLAELNVPSAVVAYRPSRFLSALYFARRESVVLATMFHEQHFPFEHKPWVETQLRDIGIRTVPWQYVADEQHADVLRELHAGPLMLRPSRGSGGVGLARVDNRESLASQWPRQSEAFVSVAPFLDDVVPVNVGACVGPRSEPTVHAPSIQLIGHPRCIDRPFGYCGNDYGAAGQLPRAVVDELEQTTIAIGRWLVSKGFAGTYGVDYLLRGSEVLFTELNPRFQGGSALSAIVDDALGLPNVHLEHVAAHLGVDRPDRPRLADQMGRSTLAHVVVHNTSGAPLRRVAPLALAPWPAEILDLTLVARPGVEVDPGGVLFRLVLNGPVTTNGFDLDQRTQTLCEQLARSFA